MRTPTKMSWENMLTRCRNPNAPNFMSYGGRGITVCERWKQFDNFLADMGDRPYGTSLDRIDNGGNYCAENCRWATRKEQSRNRRNNTVITHEGQSAPASEWAERLGVSRNTLINRLQSGWSHSDAICRPVSPRERLIEIGGKTMSVSAWSKRLGIPRTNLRRKIANNRLAELAALIKE